MGLISSPPLEKGLHNILKTSPRESDRYLSATIPVCGEGWIQVMAPGGEELHDLFALGDLAVRFQQLPGIRFQQAEPLYEPVGFPVPSEERNILGRR
ncbi:hypothetical protein FKM82_017351 [Ascaphus truei]